MNLNAIAASATRAITPPRDAILWIGTGQFEQAADYSQTPKWAAKYPVSIDVQETSSRDLRQLEGLNLGGVSSVAYVNGTLDAVSRVRQKGGDMITINGTKENYLVAAVLEAWSDWCKVALTLQLEPPNAT